MLSFLRVFGHTSSCIFTKMVEIVHFFHYLKFTFLNILTLKVMMWWCNLWILPLSVFSFYDMITYNWLRLWIKLYFVWSVFCFTHVDLLLVFGFGAKCWISSVGYVYRSYRGSFWSTEFELEHTFSIDSCVKSEPVWLPYLYNARKHIKFSVHLEGEEAKEAEGRSP